MGLFGKKKKPEGEKEGQREEQEEKPEEQEGASREHEGKGRQEAGHFFLIRGDLRRLACDVLLVPTTQGRKSAEILKKGSTFIDWWKYAKIPSNFKFPAVEEVTAGGSRVLKIPNWPENQPQPWLADMRPREGATVNFHVKGAEEFLEKVALDLQKTQKPPLHQRARHLIALPVVGTGGGGHRGSSGQVLELLISACLRATEQHHFDVCLVAISEGMFHAAQRVRERLRPSLFPSSLSPALLQKASELGRLAKHGELVVLVGAGCSAASGLPKWAELLHLLGEEVGIRPEEEGAFEHLSNLERARILERRFGSSERLQGAVVARLTDKFPNLAHYLIGGLGTHELVTLNYDVLLETACRAMGGELVILPYDPNHGNSRWLLKLHGCVTHPQDIVLTREDYESFAKRRSILIGIMQTLLLTKHMLFVGFSLNDENFHKVAVSLKEASPGGKEQKFGTAISLFRDRFAEELWGEQLSWAPMMDREAGQDPAEAREAARLVEIFLDCLSSSSFDSSHHLLNPNYDGALTPAEQGLRDLILDFKAKIDQHPEFQQIAAYNLTVGFFEKLGFGDVTQYSLD